MNEKKKLAIILPAFQPPVDWEQNIKKYLYDFVFEMSGLYEVKIYLVDDGSEPKIKVRENDNIDLFSYDKNKGKGYAIRFAISRIEADIFMFTDIDIPYDKKSMINIVRLVGEGSDISLSQRQIDYLEKSSVSRVFISKVLRWITRKLLRLKNFDTQGGLKAMNSRGKEILLKTKINRYLFDLEWIIKSERNELVIKSIPVTMNSLSKQKSIPLKILLQEFFELTASLFKK
jgi:glycosyltransferase involved in cell wall biosynthesis